MHGAAAVVAQVDGREAEFARQRRAVVLAFALPLQVVHAQAVQQYHQAASGGWQRGVQRRRLQRQHTAFVAQAHCSGERIRTRREVVAEDAIQCRQHCFPFAGHRLASGWQHRRQAADGTEQSVQAAPHQARDTADALVDEPADAQDAAHAAVLRCAGHGGDALVHGLHQVGQAERGISRQACGAPQVRQVAMGDRE